MIVTDMFGTIRHYEHSVLHRDGGPAIIWSDGDEWWYQHGKLHREDGPAIIYTDGYVLWYQHGKLHRDDGPAVVDSDGFHEWWFQGEQFFMEEWLEKANITDEQRTFLMLKYIA